MKVLNGYLYAVNALLTANNNPILKGGNIVFV